MGSKLVNSLLFTHSKYARQIESPEITELVVHTVPEHMPVLTESGVLTCFLEVPLLILQSLAPTTNSQRYSKVPMPTTSLAADYATWLSAQDLLSAGAEGYTTSSPIANG